MKAELDRQLVEKYPLVFRDRYKPMTETAMCWGFECGDGWYNIIDTLCALLSSKYNQAKERFDLYTEIGVGNEVWKGKVVTQEMLDECKEKMAEAANSVPVASQVKEKFGTLRFYVNGASDEHYNYITFAEYMSAVTCEECGRPGKLFTQGWHTVRCDEHAEKHQ